MLFMIRKCIVLLVCLQITKSTFSSSDQAPQLPPTKQLSRLNESFLELGAERAALDEQYEKLKKSLHGILSTLQSRPNNTAKTDQNLYLNALETVIAEELGKHTQKTLTVTTTAHLRRLREQYISQQNISQ